MEQHFRVFEGKVKDNVICGSEFENDKFQSSMCRANIIKKIQKLPKKEDTHIGKYLNRKGINLSGGECQKLSIARALYKEGKMLVLDEPTSAMDVFSREYFEQKFLNDIKENMVIYVTHNLKSIKKCDIIIVLDDGQIVEMGKTSELLKRKRSIISDLLNIDERYIEREQYDVV